MLIVPSHIVNKRMYELLGLLSNFSPIITRPRMIRPPTTVLPPPLLSSPLFLLLISLLFLVLVMTILIIMLMRIITVIVIIIFTCIITFPGGTIIGPFIQTKKF